MTKIELQYLKHDQTSFYEIWVDACFIHESSGIDTQQIQSQQLDCSSESEAKFRARIKIIQRFELGYVDKHGKFKNAKAFDEAYLSTLIAEQKYEQALAWMHQLDTWVDNRLEENFLKALLAQQQQQWAERYVFEKVKATRNHQILIRQIKHLSSFNPIMARLLFGNMPFIPEQVDLGIYLKNYAKAQSRMGVIQQLEQRLEQIKTQQHQLIYLVHLLDKLHDGQQIQHTIYLKACALIQLADVTDAQQKEYASKLYDAARVMDWSEHQELLQHLAQQ